MTSVRILQPYVPEYRVPFFERLISRLGSEGVECAVLAGMPKGQQALRADQATAEWIQTVQNTSFTAGIATVEFSRYGAALRGADAVILGLQATLLNVYPLLARRQFGGPKIGLWGHVRSYVNQPNALDTRLERQLMRRADHIFAYTQGGADEAIAAGVDPPKVTTVGNTVDTRDLLRTYNELTADDVARFRADIGVQDGPCVSYIGGLDASKRISFLVESLNWLWLRHPEIRILVAGRGAQQNLLQPAVERGQAHLLGFADNQLKAQMGKSSTALLNPGRIGLIAVESLAMQLPILTTDGARHAPEAEYLEAGESVFSAEDDPAVYAQLIVDHCLPQRPLHRADWQFPTLENMVSNYCSGVRRLLQ